jgi:hypothetical protein
MTDPQGGPTGGYVPSSAFDLFGASSPPLQIGDSLRNYKIAAALVNRSELCRVNARSNRCDALQFKMLLDKESDAFGVKCVVGKSITRSLTLNDKNISRM